MSFKVPEQYRILKKHHPKLGSDPTYGNNGAFQIPIHRNKIAALAIASDGDGWDHVSIHIMDKKGKASTPTCGQMCNFKNLFWDAEDCVIQYHPPHKLYVNTHPYVLHLWRPTEFNFPTPPMVMV